MKMTPKQKKIGIAAIVAVIVIVILIFVLRPAADAKNAPKGDNPNPGSPCDPSAATDMVTVLTQGSHGPEVAALQKMLNALGANLAVDCVFGPLTAAALLLYKGVSSTSLNAAKATGTGTGTPTPTGTPGDEFQAGDTLQQEVGSVNYFEGPATFNDILTTEAHGTILIKEIGPDWTTVETYPHWYSISTDEMYITTADLYKYFTLV